MNQYEPAAKVADEVITRIKQRVFETKRDSGEGASLLMVYHAEQAIAELIRDKIRALPLPDNSELVKRVARGIADNGIGRGWDDFLPVNAHDIDQDDLMEWAKAAIEATQALQSTGWKPIESAPKDGTLILLWDKDLELAISGCWFNDAGIDTPDAFEPPCSFWSSSADLVEWAELDNPTHWMPLPTPPQEQS